MESVKQIFLSILRDKNTDRATFRHAAHQLTHLIAHETLGYIPTTRPTIETPLANTVGLALSGSIMLVPILRSGITMVPIFLEYFPHASIGVVGVRRDEHTAKPHLYYSHIPAVPAQTTVLVLDPMIATGGTGNMVLEFLARRDILQKNIIFCSIICAPEGIAHLREQFPQVRHITAAIDDHLNAKKFIVPGIGDFGDRYFGTE